jgi:hypothetical protein
MRPSWRRAIGLSIAIGCLAADTAYAVDKESAPLLPSAKSRSTKVELERPAGVPEDAVLEANGARIGEVRFKALELFDIGGRDQDSKLFRLANRLHIRTREDTIADQLLFREGDLYSATTVAESARILRSTRYLRDADIRPVTLEAKGRLQDLLSHLYVLVPVLDDEKHYWVAEAEVEIEDRI